MTREKRMAVCYGDQYNSSVGMQKELKPCVSHPWPQYGNKCFRLDTSHRELEGNTTAREKEKAL